MYIKMFETCLKFFFACVYLLIHIHINIYHGNFTKLDAKCKLKTKRTIVYSAFIVEDDSFMESHPFLCNVLYVHIECEK